MSRTDTMARLLGLARLAEHCDKTGQPLQEAIAQARAEDESRRAFAKGVLAATGAAAAWSFAPGAYARVAKPLPESTQPGGSSDVAIVGAGLAGLSCAYELSRLGQAATVYEASERVGGRCASLRDFFPGQVVERGGETLHGSHHAMIGYARELGLTLENTGSFPGEAWYHFGGKRYSEAQVAEEYRAFAASIREDLGRVGAPTADRFDKSDELFDFMSIDDYLSLHEAGPLLRGVVSSAYLAEYGAPIDSLSAISFMRFVHGDKRSKQAPFGVFSGQALRIVGGMDQVATGLAARLPQPVALGHRLVAVRKLSDGRIRLSFDAGGRFVDSDHHVVVLALPFSVLRDVQFHANMELPDWKRQAIASSGMGDHSKLLVGFKEPYWNTRLGLNGTGFSDLPALQATWDANPTPAKSASAGVLAGYFGGEQARRMGPATLQGDAKAFVAALDGVARGAQYAAARDARGGLLAHVDNWSANPYSKGSTTCNRPGYFTTQAHHEAKAVGNLLFAGDHTSSFYEWQGFMEGAALSGLRSAGDVLARARVKVGAPQPVAPPKAGGADAGRAPTRRELLGALRVR